MSGRSGKNPMGVREEIKNLKKFSKGNIVNYTQLTLNNQRLFAVKYKRL